MSQSDRGMSATPADRADVKHPAVAIVIAIEATPQIEVFAENEADELALRRWIRECRPDLERLLREIRAEIRERKKTA